MEGKSARTQLRMPFFAALILLATLSTLRGQVQRIDYLTFGQGALALSVGGDAKELRVGLEGALAAIDGNPAGFVLSQKPATSDQVVELLYWLPALTTFDRFAVPNVFETPSPSQTFIRSVQILGSTQGPDEGFVELARGELSTHARRGQETEIPVASRRPVRWLQLRLSGGIDVQRDRFFQDFSELVGNGTQEPVPLDERFSGIWKYRANVLELNQEGAVVSGCYDAGGELDGTVSGNILRATGKDLVSGVPSSFLLTLSPEGEIRGVRSTNGAPFSNYVLPLAPAGTRPSCSEPSPPTLGCGSIIHGIQFDYDSALIRPESATILAALFKGLQETPGLSIVVEGHTSSEGTDTYNQSLSERRAQSVVDDLVERGIERGRIRAAGKGETEPIAPNVDESGRSLNRRVEIECAAQ